MPMCYEAPGVVRPRLSGFDLTRTLGWAANDGAEPLLRDPLPVMVEIGRMLEGCK
jgi:hypothetical protein